MKTTTVLPALAVALLCLAAPAVAAAPNTTSRPSTPNSCIELNHGDWNACNVGNSGRGDRPYLPVMRTPNTPNDCIQLNRGDWNACNVGNSGRGDAPYLPVSR